VILAADTSGLIAASDKKAPESADCRSMLAEAGTVVVSPLVLAETDHLAKARFGSAARTTLIDFLVFQVVGTVDHPVGATAGAESVVHLGTVALTSEL
jgi:predicted nucleic acid-binding protein